MTNDTASMKPTLEASDHSLTFRAGTGRRSASMKPTLEASDHNSTAQTATLLISLQ